MLNRVLAQPYLRAAKCIHVMIANHDHALLAEYRDRLRDTFDVETVSSGLECLARLREQKPDVLVLDLELPWGGGDGVLAVMHDTPLLDQIPVLLLTSCRDVATLANASRFPVNARCSMPLSPSRLVRRLHKLLAEIMRMP